MKTLACIALVLVLCGNAEARGRHPKSQAPVPHIVNQVQRGNVRFIYLHNTLPRPIWAWFECEKHLTVAPMGIPGARVVEVLLPDIEPNERCLLNHYRIQVEGESPPAWIPAALKQD